MRVGWRRKLRRALLSAALLAATALVVVVALAYALPLPARLLEPGSPVVEYRDGSPAHVFLSPDDKWRVPARLDEVDPRYVEALLRFEDKRFYLHPGVDPLAIARAAALNLSRGRVVSGASTLTMQLVRVLEPRPRSFSSKIVEAFRALQLELVLSKEEVLEAYLTFIPFGRNLEGVEAASLAYFGHTAKALSPAEIATLLAVPQRPNERYPTAANRARLLAARDSIAKRLVEEGALAAGDRARLLEVAKDPVPAELRPFPREAAHAAVWVRARHLGVDRVRTTLDRGVQRAAAAALASARAELRAKGIRDGSVVVVDHDVGEVRALVGGFDFFEDEHGAQIPGFTVPRSPGSTLKPLVYAMAIDDGRVLPDYLVTDIPVTYGGYTPRNYDERFSGLVPLRDALSQSLNVPFVNLLGEIGVERFVGALRAVGATSLDPRPGHYGLSAAVGGIELTPLELAGLFSMFARDGEHLPLRVVEPSDEGGPGLEGEARRPTRVLSAAAVELTGRALSLRDRPDFPERRRMTGVSPRVRWKTGTSFGHKDAWSAGYDETFTAVVWLGNLDNQPSAHLVGADAAGPILFDVLETLGGSRSFAPDEDTAGLRPIEVCSWSGRPPGEACPHTMVVDAVADRVPTERCPFHKRLDVDLDTGRALTPACRAGRRWESRPFLVLPPEVRRWLRQEQRRLPAPPEWAEGCAVASGRRPPAIVSPQAGRVALLVPGVPYDRQNIPLEARAGGTGTKLSWFVDGRYLGTVAPEEPLWWTPSPGFHEIVVTDDAGLADTRKLEVRSLK